MNLTTQAEIQFGREVCGNLQAAEAREWLCTNGLGSYASGTIAGSATRRYHGLLIAALQPPSRRTLLVSGVDETIRYRGVEYSLATHRWTSGATEPKGFLLLESFHLEGTNPVWTYALCDALLEKRVWMRHNENTTYVHYTLVRAAAPVDVELKVLANYRDFHATTVAGGIPFSVRTVKNGVSVSPDDGADPFYIISSAAECQPCNDWYTNFYLSAEQERGLPSHEDHFLAASFHSTLQPAQKLTLVLSTEPHADLDPEPSRAESEIHNVKIFNAWQASSPAAASEDTPSWFWQLVLAADQFIVKRQLLNNPDGRSVIAGYHWFGDWGRDTMIALPGLTLATGRPEVARKILLAFSQAVDGGMLPNNFPDAGGKPEYNTVDAALWFFEAIRQYFDCTGDLATVKLLFPILAQMMEAHVSGTRFDIHVDPSDGLLFAGEPGVQLTWMDAKIGDWVVTPRTGKPVEINALWINALQTISNFAALLSKPTDHYKTLAAKAATNFQRFWNASRNCCFDVLDVPGGAHDASLRPNQIFAVALPFSPLTAEQQKAVVDTCARELLTSFGLRSLAPGESGYLGHYAGGPRERDAAYHQGTAWGWLLGPFVQAHLRVYHDHAAAMRFIEPLGRQIYSGGLGTLGEIFEGDPPFTPRGCIAQAWTVAEILRVWKPFPAPGDKSKP